MPGGPYGKACDACRQQKKKCDAKKPACSRCARLSIACVGGGIQRYKFRLLFQQKESQNQRDAEGKTAEGAIVCRRDARRTASSSSVTSLPMAVHSPTSPLINSLIATINHSGDLRHNLYWSYPIGLYALVDVPIRLGSDNSLDCAADAVVSAHASLCRGAQLGVSPEARVKYSRALRTFRERLDDGSALQSSNTLCVIMMLLICHSHFRIAGSDGMPSTYHIEGAARILRARKRVTPCNEFERNLLTYLSGPIVRTMVSPHPLYCLEGLCY